ncbi:(E3-independent) E2 ubiquitin-conjugating enzyme UBE2O [Onthophagus taurus]|uniref:(E3-independent) E2 ubiquitin-conjugating enzyme UBE2O n=1 Tax=Onthophagus taurus TaxID=166361 RepID=UPI000C20E3D1|nr:uncharacterized protein LOC111420044 [Onthophagus taurus]
MSSTDVEEFYSNDIVYRIDARKRIVHGIVLDSYEDLGNSDEHNALQKGQLRVLWSNNSRELVWRQKKVRLLSRNIIPGDIVRRLVHGKETQRGYCKDSKQFATIQIVGTDKIVEGVFGNRLNPVTPYDRNVIVSLGEKVGRIQKLDQLITMRSKCGSTVEISDNYNMEIGDYWMRKRNRDYLELYYAGQEVICTPCELERPRWIHMTKSMKRNMQMRQRFTIQKVEPSCVCVVWFEGDVALKDISNHYTDLTPKDIKSLKYLGSLENNYLDLGQRKLLTLTSMDRLIRKRDWNRKQIVLHRSEFVKVIHNKTLGKKCNLKNARNSCTAANKTITNVNDETDEDWFTEEVSETERDDEHFASSPSSLASLLQSDKSTISITKKADYIVYPPKTSDLVVGRTVPVEVICFESKTTVVWQDGTEETDIPSTELYYSISLDDHEFFPGEWVLMTDDRDNTGKFGVVQAVNHLERTAKVKWFNNSLTNDGPPEVINITEISVYDLKKHTKFAFRPGSHVKNKNGGFQGKLGFVRDSCPEGYVMVEWHNGQTEDCWPQTIELISDGGDFIFSNSDDDEGDMSSVVSWETESIESIAGDLSEETTLQVMAARLDFIRNRIVYLKEAFKSNNVKETFTYLRDLLLVYENSSYLDKLLDTSFFSPKSRHYQSLMALVREKAKFWGVEFRGRLFSYDSATTTGNNQSPTSKVVSAEKNNIQKLVKLEHKINAQLENQQQQIKDVSSGEPSTSIPPSESDPPSKNLCVELLSMLKPRMDLAYAEIMARIGGTQAHSVMTKAQEQNIAASAPLQSIPTTPEIIQQLNSPPVFTSDTASSLALISEEKPPPQNVDDYVDNNKIDDDNSDNFYVMLDSAPLNHRFIGNKFEPHNKQTFFKSVQKECQLLKDSLPPGVWIKTYANRLDLLSVMIRGPDKTPYENGLFIFEIQLSSDYPRSPPLCHYVSYSSERLNPNLYVEGKVCISLLGTWMGQGTEVWGPESTLLQLIVSIQGLILVSEPYYNEAGYERQSASQQGYENSRTYNELVVLKMVQSMTEMIRSPPEVFKKEVLDHFTKVGDKMCDHLRKFCNDDCDVLKPEFPLLPVSKGLKISLNTSLDQFQLVLKNVEQEK